MHMWNESIASHRSCEINSCIISHLKEMQTTAISLVVYSDACGGQNRNIHIVSMWMHIVASPEYSFKTIDHKFMVSGHSYLPNDRDFGNIEIARNKTTHIYVPEDWERVVRQARRKNPFQVFKMKPEDLVSSKALTKLIVNRKKIVTNEKVEWLKTCWIRVSSDKPLQFSYRYTHNALEEWKVVDVKHKTKGCPPDLGRAKLPQLYTHPRSISQKKRTDLLELSDYIPPIHHAFYQQLNGDLPDTDDESDASDAEDP